MIVHRATLLAFVFVAASATGDSQNATWTPIVQDYRRLLRVGFYSDLEEICDTATIKFEDFGVAVPPFADAVRLLVFNQTAEARSNDTLVSEVYTLADK